ncbi:ragulator complex protein LAMTOR4-like [Gigantopelta aegis]|uniref:ragulator complex protein LAMTOR4-like n=1 Tax=Gigantopelta aegis TaxID=1735272 RepID=UPI001B88CEA5|nr:ragulator complex protein LAMTOR4-like [Gigantopelta aegis]
MAAQGLERIPDSLGYLVLTEDGAVVSSGGELENDEMMANKLTRLVYTASKIPLSADKRDTFRRISVICDDVVYMATVSNHRIYICKRQYVTQEPVVT